MTCMHVFKSICVYVCMYKSVHVCIKACVCRYVHTIALQYNCICASEECALLSVRPPLEEERYQMQLYCIVLLYVDIRKIRDIRVPRSRRMTVEYIYIVM